MKIRISKRSFELLKLVKNEDLPGKEQPTLRSEVLKIINFLHDEGLDSARLQVKRDLKKVNQNHHDISMTVQYVNKYLELMLTVENVRLCNISENYLQHNK
ncbi:hypothetical protein POM88_010057 [Heracleum sosnowskyi]|uniref:Uncharacterized protein n=1 Tax=Heracleum sosnowskyi TaxID=360622 RepID=A0AAD8J9X9_9APIA|nr:hypothetical protein POM88_010057 [Heracleum sosnowskyi]